MDKRKDFRLVKNHAFDASFACLSRHGLKPVVLDNCKKKNPEVAPFQASIRPSPAVVVEVVIGVDVVDVVVVVAAKANRPDKCSPAHRKKKTLLLQTFTLWLPAVATVFYSNAISGLLP